MVPLEEYLKVSSKASNEAVDDGFHKDSVVIVNAHQDLSLSFS